MSKNKRLESNMKILYSALEVAREGLKMLEGRDPIAKTTLMEIDKICNKIWEE